MFKILIAIIVNAFFFLGDLIDSVKSAAEGVKNQSSTVATWMKKNVNPTMRNILPTSSDSSPGEPQPSTSAAVWARRPVSFRDITFKASYVQGL